MNNFKNIFWRHGQAGSWSQRSVNCGQSEQMIKRPLWGLASGISTCAQSGQHDQSPLLILSIYLSKVIPSLSLVSMTTMKKTGNNKLEYPETNCCFCIVLCYNFQQGAAVLQEASSIIFESLVWLDMRLNPGSLVNTLTIMALFEN